MKKLIYAIMIAALLLTLSGCGASVASTEATVAQVELPQLYDAIVDQLPEMLVLDEEMVMNFCGIDSASCAQVVVAIADSGLNTDEIWLVEAADATALDDIESLAATRLRMKEEETISYAPEQYEVVKKAKTIRSGLYFALIVTPEVEAVSQRVADAIG